MREIACRCRSCGVNPIYEGEYEVCSICQQSRNLQKIEEDRRKYERERDYEISNSSVSNDRHDNPVDNALWGGAILLFFGYMVFELLKQSYGLTIATIISVLIASGLIYFIYLCVKPDKITPTYRNNIVSEKHIPKIKPEPRIESEAQIKIKKFRKEYFANKSK